MNPSPVHLLPCVIFMMKAAQEGEVKTRLASEIGNPNATRLYRRFVEYLCEELFLETRGRWQTVFACAPAEAMNEIREWLEARVHRAVRFEPQVEGDLGARLQAQVEAAFAQGAPAVLALGTDCLDLSVGEIDACFEALRTHDVVLGEALDGGYWCIGLSAPQPELFRGMPWSQPGLAAMTREKARSLGLRVAERPKRRDIDRKEDLMQLPEELRRAAKLDQALWRNAGKTAAAPKLPADQ